MQVDDQVPQNMRRVMWQARPVGVTTHPDHAWREVAPTKAEPTVDQRVQYLQTLKRADGSKAYEFRALYVVDGPRKVFGWATTDKFGKFLCFTPRERVPDMRHLEKLKLYALAEADLAYPGNAPHRLVTLYE